MLFDKENRRLVCFIVGLLLGFVLSSRAQTLSTQAATRTSTGTDTSTQAAREKAAGDAKAAAEAKAAKEKASADAKAAEEAKAKDVAKTDIPKEAESLKIDSVWSNAKKSDKPAKVRGSVTDASDPTISITLKVSGIAKLPKEGDYTAAKLIPYVNGAPLSDAHLDVDLANQELHFRFSITDKSLPQWLPLLGLTTKKVDFGLGWNATGPKVSAGDLFRIQAATWPRITVFSVCSLGLLLATIILGRRTSLLRDQSVGPDPASGQKPPSTPSDAPKFTYSLARTQMAWWLVISAVSFLFVWALLAKWSFNPKVLALLGISGATGLSSVLIDSNKQKAAATQLQQALTEKSVQLRDMAVADSELLRAGIDTETQKGLVVLAEQANRERIKLIDNKIEALKQQAAGPPIKSSGFFSDLLSDKDGISLHRYQLLVWTAILGTLFIYKVLTSLVMPNFDDTLLTLLGISGGLYVGFKWPEPPK
jgi:hypothetical protein